MNEIESMLQILADERPFVIFDAHANVLIQCACGDVISFSGLGGIRQCDSCSRRYRIKLTVVEITHEEEQSVIIRENTEEQERVTV